MILWFAKRGGKKSENKRNERTPNSKSTRGPDVRELDSEPNCFSNKLSFGFNRKGRLNGDLYPRRSCFCWFEEFLSLHSRSLRTVTLNSKWLMNLASETRLCYRNVFDQISQLIVEIEWRSKSKPVSRDAYPSAKQQVPSYRRSRKFLFDESTFDLFSQVNVVMMRQRCQNVVVCELRSFVFLPMPLFSRCTWMNFNCECFLNSNKKPKPPFEMSLLWIENWR